MRETWDSKHAFILATIGSAIGLGNVWRFPYICYKHGGGAFLIPYLVALFAAGIPLMILEFSIGHKMRKGAPGAFAAAGKNKEWVGWFSLLVAFGILSYYAVVMGWCFNYFGYSFNLAWGTQTEEFFKQKFLAVSDGPFNLGGFRPWILLTLFVGWIVIVGCVWRGCKTVGKVVYLTVILPWIILAIFVVRGLTLPGAFEGLRFYITPNFAALRDYEVWRAAFTQVFFSLSIGFGILIAYASYLPEKSDIVKSAFIISFANAGTSLFAGVAVFSTLGYLSHTQGVPIPHVVDAGFGLVFVVYPMIINLLPFANELFGALFFLMLVTLAIDSAFSLVEAGSAGIMDKWNITKRSRMNIGFAIVGIAAGLIYTTGAGLYWLDIVDQFAQNFGLTAVGLIECIVLGYMFKLSVLRDHCNAVSDIKLGKWWDVCIRIVTPVVLTALLVLVIIERIKGSYGGYPRSAEFLGGWMILGLFLILSIILMRVKGKNVA
jgi:NSS family neurotransmitter:Na+ symporter